MSAKKPLTKSVDMQKDANSPNTPTKIYYPDQFCRVCQCNIAIVGRGKCNIFSGKSSKSNELARRLSIVFDESVEKEDNVSSIICYKCKREMEKYEGYMKALNVDLKAFRERYQKSVEEQRCRHNVCVKRCLRLSGTPTKEPSVLPKRRFISEMNDPNTRAIVVRPLLPASVITDPVPEMSLLPCHEDLFIVTTPGSSTEVCLYYLLTTVCFKMLKNVCLLDIRHNCK